MKQRQKIGQDHAVVRGKIGDPGDLSQHCRTITFYQRFNDLLNVSLINCSQHRTDITGRQLLVTEGDRLIRQAKRITHTAIGSARQQPKCRVFKGDCFFRQDIVQVTHNVLWRHPLQVELEAARENGHRKFLGIGGGKQEFNVFRRFFQCFQQGVETGIGQHVDFVDQVYLESPTGRRVLNVVQQLPHILYLGTGCRIDLNQINKTPTQNFLTAITFTTWRRRNAGFAVEAACQQPADGGFANPTCAGKKIGVMQPLMVECVNQSLEHMLLADHILKCFWPPFPGQYLITHRMRRVPLLLAFGTSEEVYRRYGNLNMSPE